MTLTWRLNVPNSSSCSSCSRISHHRHWRQLRDAVRRWRTRLCPKLVWPLSAVGPSRSDRQHSIEQRVQLTAKLLVKRGTHRPRPRRRRCQRRIAACIRHRRSGRLARVGTLRSGLPPAALPGDSPELPVPRDCRLYLRVVRSIDRQCSVFFLLSRSHRFHYCLIVYSISGELARSRFSTATVVEFILY